MQQEKVNKKFSIFNARVFFIVVFFIIVISGTFLSNASKTTPNFINSSLFAFPEKELEPGATQSYSLIITNSGQSEATNVIARASISSNLQVLDVTNGKYDLDSGSAIWNIKSIAPGHSVTVAFMGRLNPDALTDESVAVQMYVSSKELREHKVETIDTKVKSLPNGRSAKLVAFQTVSSNKPQAGEEVMLHVIVTNEGQLPAENVITSEQLPPELELLPDTIHPHLSNFARSTEPVSSFDLAKNSIKVKVDKLMPGEWVALMFSARVKTNITTDKEIVPQALIKADKPNFQSNAPVNLTVTPQAANVNVMVQADKNMVASGDKITYTITVTNSGDTKVTKLKIMNKIPQGLTLVSGASTTSCGLKIVESAGQVLWKKGTLDLNGGLCKVSYQATVNAGVASGTVITNTATVKAPTGVNTSGNTTTTVMQSAASSAGVDVLDNFFSPATLMVPAGTMITWSQKGNSVHTVTGSNCNSSSGFTFSSDTQFPNGMRSGDKYSFSVPANAKAGTMVYYFCRFHGGPGNCTTLGPGMAGVVIVK